MRLGVDWNACNIDKMQPTAPERNVSELLKLQIMRVESLFEPHNLSTQRLEMPATAVVKKQVGELLKVLKGTFFEWNEDKVPRMAAAIAFYALFSLTSIVVIAFKVAESTF